MKGWLANIRETAERTGSPPRWLDWTYQIILAAVGTSVFLIWPLPWWLTGLCGFTLGYQTSNVWLAFWRRYRK